MARCLEPFILLILCSFVWCQKEYYKRLNVPETASTYEIKRQFRRIAKELHPDMNKNDPQAAEKFRLLAEAHEVLTNEKKRELYDKYGEEGLKQNAHGEQHFDPFASFFGFGFNFGERRSSDDVIRGNDVVMDLWVTLKELYVGDFVEISRLKLDKKNADGTRKCRCRFETQTKMLGAGRFEMRQVEVCDECQNVSFHREERHLELEIEPGMRDGQLYPFVAEGEPHPDGDAGDLKFRVRQQTDPQFQRRGDDLYTNLTLTLVESLVGFHLSLTHLDGHPVILKSEGLTPPGTIIHKPHEGMPNFENPRVRGSLYITVDVAYPTGRQLTDEERAKLFDIFPQDTGSGRAVHADPLPATVYNGLDAPTRSRVPNVSV